MTILALAKAGYGSVNEIEQWDTPKFLDAVEFEQITQNIELYHIQKAQK